MNIDLNVSICFHSVICIPVYETADYRAVSIKVLNYPSYIVRKKDIRPSSLTKSGEKMWIKGRGPELPDF